MVLTIFKVLSFWAGLTFSFIWFFKVLAVVVFAIGREQVNQVNDKKVSSSEKIEVKPIDTLLVIISWTIFYLLNII